MQPFVYFFLFPILAVFTVGFIFSSLRARRLEALQKNHEDSEHSRHIEKAEQLTRIDGNISMLSARIDEKVLPAVTGLYEAVTKLRPLLTRENIKAFLVATLGGEDRVLVVSDDPLFLISGCTHNDIKVTLLMRYFPKSNDLVFNSFACRFPSITEEILRKIVQWNARIKIGCLYTEDVAGTQVLFLKHTIHCPCETISANLVEEVLLILGETLTLLIAELQRTAIPYSPLVLEEYIPLHNQQVEIDAAKEKKTLKEPEKSFGVDSGPRTVDGADSGASLQL